MAKILIVDDEPDLRFLLRTMLTRHGYDVIEASNGQQALEMIAESTPDLILTDLMMPVMDGRELIARLRAERSLALIPIALVSAVADDTIGADIAIRKPFGLDIMARIAELLARGAA